MSLLAKHSPMVSLETSSPPLASRDRHVCEEPWYVDFEVLTEFGSLKSVCDGIKEQCEYFAWSGKRLGALKTVLRAGDPWRAKDVLSTLRTERMTRSSGESLEMEGVALAEGSSHSPPVWAPSAVSMCEDLYCAAQVLRARVAVLQTVEKQCAQIETSFLLSLKRLKEEKTANKKKSEEIESLISENAKLRSETEPLQRDLASTRQHLDRLSLQLAAARQETDDLRLVLQTSSEDLAEARRQTAAALTVATELTVVGSSTPKKAPKSKSRTSSPARGGHCTHATHSPSLKQRTIVISPHSETTVGRSATPRLTRSKSKSKSRRKAKSGSSSSGRRSKRHLKKKSVADMVIAQMAQSLQLELTKRHVSDGTDVDSDASAPEVTLYEIDTGKRTVTKRSPTTGSSLKAPESGSGKKPKRNSKTSMSDIVFAKSFASKWAKRAKKKTAKKKKRKKKKTVTTTTTTTTAGGSSSLTGTGDVAADKSQAIEKLKQLQESSTALGEATHRVQSSREMFDIKLEAVKQLAAPQFEE